jgi:Acetyltransferase (GNAT) domain
VIAYRHPRYAESLSEFGTPRELPLCQGWILERDIPEFPYRDAMGCYPLFACQDWSKLHLDLDEIRGDDLVSITLVADPFGPNNETYLQRCFPDLVRPFKEHFVVDLCQPLNQFVTKHHRYYARRALARVTVETCPDPGQFLDEWVDLYATLSKRQNFRGIKAFSRRAFTIQLGVPGLVVFRAVSQGLTVGAHLWYVEGDVAHSHLAAFSPLGYELMASYALYWSALQYFADKVRWLALGAGPGAESDGTDGLSWFKQGWSTGTRTVYLCGRIFNRKRYAEILGAKNIPTAEYFPAYRRGEF